MNGAQVSIDKRIDKERIAHTHTHTHTYTHTNGILLSHKKNEIVPTAMTWMELESIMLSEINQRKTNTT